VLTEDDLVDAVCDHLETAGYEIMRRCATTQRGDDIVAVRRRSSIALYIEAKGETSNRPTSKRYGKAFSRSQCRDHVANAFYTAARMMDAEGMPKELIRSTLGVSQGPGIEEFQATPTGGFSSGQAERIARLELPPRVGPSQSKQQAPPRRRRCRFQQFRKAERAEIGLARGQ
jgi:hypothetical protein